MCGECTASNTRKKDFHYYKKVTNMKMEDKVT